MMDAMMTSGQDDVEILQKSYPVWYSEVGVRPFMNLHNIRGKKIKICCSVHKDNFKSKD